MHYNSHGPSFFIISPLTSRTPSKVYSSLFHLRSTLVGGEHRFTSLVGNMCAKLISTSHAERKHRDFSATDKNTRHLTKLFGKAALL